MYGAVCSESYVGKTECLRDGKLEVKGWFTSLCFFFQAEDGIRDLVRSRGLGDVYKRQDRVQGVPRQRRAVDDHSQRQPYRQGDGKAPQRLPVSYTHLTLPTIYSV